MKQYQALLSSIFLSAALAFSSCSVQQEIYMAEDGSGTTSVDLELSPMLVRYLDDLIDFTGQDPTATELFDIEEMHRVFAEIPELELLRAAASERSRLSTVVRFESINQVFLEQVGPDVEEAARIEREGEVTTLFLYLDRDNYRQIVERVLRLSSLDDYSTYMSGLLEPDSKELILEIYRYAFEEYAKEKTVQQVLEQSKVVFDVYINGKIVRRTGGTVIEGKNGFDTGVRYEIPLLDILTLEEPVRYSLSFRE
jgi:hypothetical protein